MKLYLMAGLSVLSLVLSILVFAGLVPVDGRETLGVQYLLVGIGLAVLYFMLGGFRSMRLGRQSSAGADSDADAPLPIIDLRDGAETNTVIAHPSHADPHTNPRSNLAGPAHVVRFGQTGLEPSDGWDVGTQVTAAVRRRDEQLVDRMIDEGMLTTDGPLTHADVRAMMWVAVSSIELTDSLLTALSGPPELETVDPPQPGELMRGDQPN